MGRRSDAGIMTDEQLENNQKDKLNHVLLTNNINIKVRQVIFFRLLKKHRLFENQLCEVIQTIFPNDEVMLSVRVVDECARDAFLVAECLELDAVANQTVSTTAYHPEEFVLFLHLFHIWNEL